MQPLRSFRVCLLGWDRLSFLYMSSSTDTPFYDDEPLDGGRAEEDPLQNRVGGRRRRRRRRFLVVP